MVDAHDRQLFTYADSNDADWQEFRPGSRRKVLMRTRQQVNSPCWSNGMPDTGWAPLNSTSTTNICIS